jgi:hypothetical protein
VDRKTASSMTIQDINPKTPLTAKALAPNKIPRSSATPGGSSQKKKDVTYFGDHDFAIDNAMIEGVATNLMLVDEDLASWNEIWHTCCSHNEREWLKISAAIVALSFFLYFFVFGLALMGAGSKVMGGCASGELFGRDVRSLETTQTLWHFTLRGINSIPHSHYSLVSSHTFNIEQTNPVSSLMIGILTTVFLQSSSSVVGIVVALQEAGALSVDAGIYTVSYSRKGRPRAYYG